MCVCVFLQAVSVGKHVKGYHYIIANLVSKRIFFFFFFFFLPFQAAKPRLSIFPVFIYLGDGGRDEYEMQRRPHVYVF